MCIHKAREVDDMEIMAYAKPRKNFEYKNSELTVTPETYYSVDARGTHFTGNDLGPHRLVLRVERWKSHMFR